MPRHRDWLLSLELGEDPVLSFVPRRSGIPSEGGFPAEEWEASCILQPHIHCRCQVLAAHAMCATMEIHRRSETTQNQEDRVC